jgi:endonuclease/exonuclease/phosphatase family metal-dependent hydrolase
MASVHLESHCDPATRRADTEHLLAVLDRIDPTAPVILGGDFNTITASREERDDRGAWYAALAADPLRLIRPETREPLFDVLAAQGYDWHACNVADIPTTRHADPRRPRAKIDWFFTRGLTASNPEIIPALQPDGTPSSDHDCLVVSIAPA